MRCSGLSPQIQCVNFNRIQYFFQVCVPLFAKTATVLFTELTIVQNRHWMRETLSAGGPMVVIIGELVRRGLL